MLSVQTGSSVYSSGIVRFGAQYAALYFLEVVHYWLTQAKCIVRSQFSFDSFAESRSGRPRGQSIGQVQTAAEQNEPLDRPVGFESAPFSESAPCDTAKSTGSESNGHGCRQNLEWTPDTVSTLTFADHAF